MAQGFTIGCPTHISSSSLDSSDQPSLPLFPSVSPPISLALALYPSFSLLSLPISPFLSPSNCSSFPPIVPLSLSLSLSLSLTHYNNIFVGHIHILNWCLELREWPTTGPICHVSLRGHCLYFLATESVIDLLTFSRSHLWRRTPQNEVPRSLQHAPERSTIDHHNGTSGAERRHGTLVLHPSVTLSSLDKQPLIEDLGSV